MSPACPDVHPKAMSRNPLKALFTIRYYTLALQLPTRKAAVTTFFLLSCAYRNNKNRRGLRLGAVESPLAVAVPGGDVVRRAEHGRRDGEGFFLLPGAVARLRGGGRGYRCPRPAVWRADYPREVRIQAMRHVHTYCFLC